jgi:hypothetical protein
VRQTAHCVIARARALPLPLAALLVAAAIGALAWAMWQPPFQGPDEVAHISYAQHLAEVGRSPFQDAVGERISNEELVALTYLGLGQMRGNTFARPLANPLLVALFHRYEDHVSANQRAFGTTDEPGATIGRDPPLAPALDAVAYDAARGLGGDLLTATLWMRILDVVLFVIAVGLTWMLAGELFGPRVLLQTLAAGAVALQPEAVSLAGSVSDEPLLLVLFTAAALLSVRVVRRGRSWPRLGLLAVLVVAAALTEARGVALVVPAMAAVLAGLYRHRGARRPSARAVVTTIAVTVVGLVVVVVLADQVFDTGLRRTFHGFIPRQFFSYMWQFYLPKLSFMQPMLGPHYGFRQTYVDTFFGTFSQREINLPTTVLDLLHAAVLVGLAALVAACVARRRALRREWDVVVVLALFPLTELVLLHIASFRTLLMTVHTRFPNPQITGRYLIVLLGFFGVALALVTSVLPRRAQPVLVGALLGVGALLSISALGLMAVRFYA